MQTTQIAGNWGSELCHYAMPDLSTPVHTPRVSVIMPIRDHRGLALDSVSSWVNAQTCVPELFEVIVILDETVTQLENSLRSLLRQHDRLLTVSTPNEMKQYDIGARQASGEYLFFSEPHCLAAPTTVVEIMTYFKTQPFDGFCAKSLPICRNRIAALEYRMFEEGWQIWSQEGH